MSWGQQPPGPGDADRERDEDQDHVPDQSGDGGPDSQQPPPAAADTTHWRQWGDDADRTSQPRPSSTQPRAPEAATRAGGASPPVPPPPPGDDWGGAPVPPDPGWGQAPPPPGDDWGRAPVPPDPGWGQAPPAPGGGWGQPSPQRSGWGDDGGGRAAANRLRPLNLGDVLDGMFRLAVKHWRAFAIAAGVVIVPLSLLNGLLLAQVMGAMPGFMELAENPELQATFAEGTTPDVASLARLAATALVAVMASLLFTPLIYGIVVHVAAVGYRDGHVEPMDSVRAGGRRYLSLLATIVMFWLVPAVVVLVPLVLFVLGAALQIDALIAIGVLGFLVALVVAVIALVRLSLCIAALMIEGIGPVAALRRSNELVSGRTGATLGVLLLVWIIVGIIGSVLAAPFQFATFAAGGSAGAVVSTVSQALSTLVQDALLGTALVLVYFDRRVRTEGYDLTELAGELGERRDQAW